MKSFTRTIHQCELCGKEYKVESEASVCEKFCHLLDSSPVDIFKSDADELSIEKKRKVLKDISNSFKKFVIDE